MTLGILRYGKSLERRYQRLFLGSNFRNGLFQSHVPRVCRMSYDANRRWATGPISIVIYATVTR